MPWYCGHCSRWNKKEYRCCPDCGRPPKGRVCRSCKTAVPKHAAHCTTCGSRRLSDPGMATLPFSVPVRLALLLGALVLAWLLLQLLAPVALALGHWVFHLFAHLLFLAVLFWLFTGLLPTGWGSRVRAGCWRLISLAGRFLINLFK